MTGVLKENIISVFLLQIFMFDSMCSLSLVVKFTIYIHINLQYLSENCFHNKFISVYVAFWKFMPLFTVILWKRAVSELC